MFFLKLVQYAFTLTVAHTALRRRGCLESGLSPSNARYEDASALLHGGLRFAKSTSSINDACPVQRRVSVGIGEEALVTERCGRSFGQLRQLWGVDDVLWRLGGCETSVALAAQVDGGSRGAKRRGNIFLLSRDGQFILKQESHSCLELLEGGVAARYARRAGKVPSLLPRLVGAYTVTFRGKMTHWLVTTNVFGARPRGFVRIRERYDVKGSTAGRRTRPKSSTLKDLDAQEDAAILQSASLQKANKVIMTLKDDTALIQNLGLLDYSLLIGICDTTTIGEGFSFFRNIFFAPACASFTAGFKYGSMRRGVNILPTSSNDMSFLVVGLIDIFQPWTWAKLIEFIARGTLHGYCAISAVPPGKYRARFLTFIAEVLHGDVKHSPLANTCSNHHTEKCSTFGPIHSSIFWHHG